MLSSIQCTSIRSIYFFISGKKSVLMRIDKLKFNLKLKSKAIENTQSDWNYDMSCECDNIVALLLKTKGEKRGNAYLRHAEKGRRTNQPFNHVFHNMVAAGCWWYRLYIFHWDWCTTVYNTCMNWDLANIFQNVKLQLSKLNFLFIQS